MRKTCLSYFYERNIGEGGKEHGWMFLPSLFDLKNVHCDIRPCWYFHVKIRTSVCVSLCTSGYAMEATVIREIVSCVFRNCWMFTELQKNMKRVSSHYLYILTACLVTTKCKSVILHVFPKWGFGKICMNRLVSSLSIECIHHVCGKYIHYSWHYNDTLMNEYL